MAFRKPDKHFQYHWKNLQILFLARATVGTSLYVPLFQSVSQLVSQSASAIPFFKIHISVLLDHVGRRNFAWKLYVLVSIHPTTREAWQHFYLRIWCCKKQIWYTRLVYWAHNLKMKMLSKMKMTSKWRWPQNKDELKNEDDLNLKTA